MRLLTDGTVRHRPGLEPLHDLRDRLHFVDRNRGPMGAEVQQATDRDVLARLVVDEFRVFLVDVVVV